METGTITTVRVEAGYGFIRRAVSPDIFFHCKELRGLEFDARLQEMRVQFDVEETPKGPRATNVYPVDA